MREEPRFGPGIRRVVSVFVLTLLFVGLFASIPTGRADEITEPPFSLGALPEDIPEEERVVVYAAGALPTHFDWRNQNGQNWMTSVKNQGGCGSCVAFGAVGALEGQLRIEMDEPYWNLDLSEQHLFSCGGGKCSMGWYLSSALRYLQQYGTPDEACAPYQGRDVACSSSCPDWQSRAYKIESWNWVVASPEAIEAALQNGPLLARFDVYTDFFSYRGGVYHHTSGSLAGGHAITIVGYDSVERYWIVKNSWGASWGESGYFRIGFGEVGIEQAAASISAALPPAPTSQTVTFYTDPPSGTITADGVTKTDGSTETYSSGQRVHVAAVVPSGYQFSSWEANGVSVDSASSADTYMTASNSGWLKAHLTNAQPPAPPAPPPSGQVTVGSKTTFGDDFSGAKVKVDRKKYSTPFSLTLQGAHTFTAPSRVRKFTFVRWEGATCVEVSSAPSFTCEIQSDKAFYAIYDPPRVSITVRVKDATARKAVAGASVHVEGTGGVLTDTVTGTTDASGKFVISGVYAGTYQLTVSADSYNAIETTISVSRNTRQNIRLTPTA